jgi:hypothetical protein
MSETEILPSPESVPQAADNDQELNELLAAFTDITDRRQRAFLAAYIVGKGLKAAQRLSGVTRASHYNWLEKDPVYRERFHLARTMLADEGEEEAYRRAFLGYDTPVHYHGKIVSSYKSYSDALTIFLLRGMKREVYGPHAADFNFDGPSGIDITIRKEGEEPKDLFGRPVISIPVDVPDPTSDASALRRRSGQEEES